MNLKWNDFLSRHLLPNEKKILCEIYDKTSNNNKKYRKKEFNWAEITEQWIPTDEFKNILTILNGYQLISWENTSSYASFRITEHWREYVRSIKAEENKKWRQKLLDRTTTFKNFISILIALGALIVSVIALIQK